MHKNVDKNEPEKKIFKSRKKMEYFKTKITFHNLFVHIFHNFFQFIFNLCAKE